ncbi:D-alanine--D-alanine ligase [Vibrio vulnificus]|nr:D-alanine--D-alanine ligase [Vibrio vulnificus]
MERTDQPRIKTQEPAQTSISNRSRSDSSNRSTSFFEFWPTWLMYLPVGFMWLVWSIRYRSPTLPLIANPRIFLSGMVGGSKAQLMSQATGKCADTILPWVKITKTNEALSEQTHRALQRLNSMNISFPFVCKPDTGCRGAGVKLIQNQASFSKTLAQYPTGAGIILQQLSRYPDEVGIFFVKYPSTSAGNVVSLTFKNRPEVIGDGKSTVCELVQQDERAAKLSSLYQSRNQLVWHSVLPEGQHHSLLFSASHCRGAVFQDGRQHITPALNHAINIIMQDLPEFHYGRMDVKYKDLASLKLGEHLEIVEINGASSESIHIWDKDAKLLDAFKTLLWQYKTLFEIGDRVRKSGESPPSILALIRAWRHEKQLSAAYPEND